jgi:hypothetical protein
MKTKGVSFTEASRQYLDFRDLKKQDEAFAHGWLDFHAGRAEALGLKK